jgi:hypothetical protein
MDSWDITFAARFSEQDKLLSDGWEPFGVVALPDGEGGTEAVVYFRKKESDWEA